MEEGITGIKGRSSSPSLSNLKKNEGDHLWTRRERSSSSRHSSTVSIIVPTRKREEATREYKEETLHILICQIL
jgi:hypothetical protein